MLLARRRLLDRRPRVPVRAEATDRILKDLKQLRGGAGTSAAVNS